MESIINFIKDNWQLIENVILAIIALASAICKLTPNTKDDTVVSKIKDFISVFSLFNSDGSSIGQKKETEEDK